MRGKKTLCAGVAAMALIGVGCGSDHSREDADDTRGVCPRTSEAQELEGCVDKRQPKTISFNNKYPNVQAKCDHTNRVYVVTVGEFRMHVVENDPACGGAR